MGRVVSAELFGKEPFKDSPSLLPVDPGIGIPYPKLLGSSRQEKGPLLVAPARGLKARFSLLPLLVAAADLLPRTDLFGAAGSFITGAFSLGVAVARTFLPGGLSCRPSARPVPSEGPAASAGGVPKAGESILGIVSVGAEHIDQSVGVVERQVSIMASRMKIDVG
jgi:hypothetical protein